MQGPRAGPAAKVFERWFASHDDREDVRYRRRGGIPPAPVTERTKTYEQDYS